MNHPISISKVGPEITSLAFNERGGLLAYGDTKGEIKVKEASKKLYLKSFNHHSKAVYSLCFIPQTSYLAGASDDQSVSYMDYAVGRVLHRIGKAHTDFVRSVQSFESSSDTLMTGSYDKTVKIFDVREQGAAKLVFKNEVEVEDLKLYNGDVSFVTVGDRFVRCSDGRPRCGTPG